MKTGLPLSSSDTLSSSIVCLLCGWLECEMSLIGSLMWLNPWPPDVGAGVLFGELVESLIPWYVPSRIG